MVNAPQLLGVAAAATATTTNRVFGRGAASPVDTRADRGLGALPFAPPPTPGGES